MNIHDIIEVINTRDVPRDRNNWPTTDIAGDLEGLCRLLVPYIVDAWLRRQTVWPEAVDAARFEIAVRREPSDYFGLLDDESLRYALGGDNTIVRGPFGCWYLRRRPGTDNRNAVWHEVAQ